jgi:hypothetical protein
MVIKIRIVIAVYIDVVVVYTDIIIVVTVVHIDMNMYIVVIHIGWVRPPRIPVRRVVAPVPGRIIGSVSCHPEE